MYDVTLRTMQGLERFRSGICFLRTVLILCHLNLNVQSEPAVMAEYLKMEKQIKNSSYTHGFSCLPQNGNNLRAEHFLWTNNDWWGVNGH